MATGDRRQEKVLVLGDDMRIFLAVVRSLGRAGKEVHVAPFNWHSPALKSKYIAKIHYFPRYSDDPSAWREAVRATLRANSFDLVVPCDDPGILPLHAHRDELTECPLALHNPLAMDVLFDKEHTRALCIELGIPVTPGARIDEGTTAHELRSRFGLPLVIKSRRSYWIDKIDVMAKPSIVRTEAELDQLLGSLGDRSRTLVEGFFEGVGVGVSVLAHNGKILQAFQHRRLREGTAGPSSYRISEALNSGLYGACEKICARTKLTGVCMFEFRYNLTTHDWVLIETNARFWGSLPLPLSLGVDFPRFLYDLFVHKIEHPPVRYAIGIRARNFVLDGFNLLSEMRRLSRGRIGNWVAAFGDYLMQPWRWMTGQERSDSFVRDDLRPALWECAMLLTSVMHKASRPQGEDQDRRRGDLNSETGFGHQRGGLESLR